MFSSKHDGYTLASNCVHIGGKLSERDHDDAESESVGDTVNSGKRGIANAAWPGILNGWMGEQSVTKSAESRDWSQLADKSFREQTPVTNTDEYHGN